MNRTVRWSVSPRSLRALLDDLRSSTTPLDTAEMWTKRAFAAFRGDPRKRRLPRSRGHPQDHRRQLSRVDGPAKDSSLADDVLLPTNSDRSRGRMRAASG
jgi:hypothetical protein